jgi:hypothetical protein
MSIRICATLHAHLVECGEYVIRELDFSDGCMTHRRKTNAKSCDALLRQRGVENALPPWSIMSRPIEHVFRGMLTEFLSKTLRSSE